MYKIITASLALLLIAHTATSQDKIYRMNGKTVLAKVLEVGSSEIKYRDFSNPDGPVYVLETDRISKIVYENGKVENLRPDPKDMEVYGDQRRQALKLNFFAPLYGYTEIGYEKNLAVGRSIEYSVGFIGLGKSSDYYYSSNGLGTVKRGQAGGFASIAYKFGKLPDFIIFGRSRMSHLMQGSYVRPHLYLGHYKENRVYEKAGGTAEIGKQNVTFGALQIEIGKQWVFSDRVLLDFYWGLGYGADNKKSFFRYDDPTYDYYNIDEASAWNYANARAGNSPGLSVTFGIKIGMLLKNKKKE